MAILYTIAEEFLENFGMDGHACLLRAICEVHGQPYHKYGFLGEVVKLFLSASKSPYAHLLGEYVDAERAGLEDGECWKFYKDCSKSLFHSSDRNKYSQEHIMEGEEEEEKDTMTSSIPSGGITRIYKNGFVKSPEGHKQNSVISDKGLSGTKKVITKPDNKFM